MDLAPNDYLNNQQPDDDRLTTATTRDEEYGRQWGDAEPEDKDVVGGAADPELYDELINTEVTIHNDSELRCGRVVKCAQGNNGKPIGRRNPSARFNPELGTHEYMIEFDDGAVDCFTENIIARNIFSQVDTDGHEKTVTKEVVDHQVNGKAVNKENGFIVTRSGTCRPKFTTAG